MNIVIVGGGSKFGKHAAQKFLDLDHKVYVLSHKKSEFAFEHHRLADFTNTLNVISEFNILCQDIDVIDMFVYLSVPKDFYEGPELYQSSENIANENMWTHAIKVHASLPHDLITRALLKMNANSRIVFMTSGLSLTLSEHESEYSFLTTYAGCKSAQNFLMRAFSRYNDKKATVCSVSTHFPLDTESDDYKWKADRVVDLILSINQNNNGKVITYYDFNQAPVA